MKKVFYVMILLAIVLAACAPTPSAPAEPAEPAEAESAEAEPAEAEPTGPVEISFWNIDDNWWDEYTAKFNEEHPDINVKLEVFETEPYKTKISSAMIAGTEPCIFYQIPGPETESWLEQGKIMKLDSLLDADRFVPSARAGCSSNGDLVCLPFYLSPSYFYYNKAQFAEAGIDVQNWADPMTPTWEEFLAAGEAVKDAGYVPLAVGNADNWPGLFYYWAAQNRYGGLKEFNGAVSGTGSFTDPSFIKAGEVVQDLADRGFFPEGVNGIAGDAKYQLFIQEDASMIYMGTWMVENIKNGAAEGFEYGIFNFPSFADGDPDSQTDIMTGIDGAWVSASCPYPEAAAEYLKGFYEEKTALWFLEATGNIPSVAGVIESAKAANLDTPAILLSEAAGTAAHAYPWWDWALAPAMSEEMLSMSQGLFEKSITPEEFAERVEAVR